MSNSKSNPIRYLRHQLGLSQRNFANKFHIPLEVVLTWEGLLEPVPEYVVFMLSRLVAIEKCLSDT